MPTINKISFSNARTARFRSTPQQNMSMPKQDLKQDTVSFGFWPFGKKEPKNEYFSPEAYKEVQDYLEKEKKPGTSQTNAYGFVLHFKRYGEEGHYTDVDENVRSFVDKVEPEKIPEVLGLLDQIKKNLPDSPFIYAIEGAVEEHTEKLNTKLKKLTQS